MEFDDLEKMDGNGFVKIREKIGISQTDFAKLMGLSSASMYKIETGFENKRATLQQREHARKILFLWEKGLLFKYCQFARLKIKTEKLKKPEIISLQEALKKIEELESKLKN